MELQPLSLLNDLLYCPRRAALKVVEGWRAANYQTDRGDIAHEHADLAGYEVQKGVTLLRALPVWSGRLGLSGKCDIVELRGRLPRERRGPPAAAPASGPADFSLLPVEYKVGARRKFENDDVQVCAQAICLEEMFATRIPRGAIYHADSKRRREVEFTEDLRHTTEETITALHSLLASGDIPPAHYIEGRCEKCSLFDTCLPQITGEGRVAAQSMRAACDLFRT